jgi:hypothetical protein
MTISQKGRLSLQVSSTLDKPESIGFATYTASDSHLDIIENGTGANKSNMVYSTFLNISASSNIDQGLFDAESSELGGLIAFLKIKVVVITAASTNTADVQVGGGSNAFSTMFANASDALLLKPGGLIALSAAETADGFGVTPATGDLLRFTNLSGSDAASVTLTLIGEES